MRPSQAAKSLANSSDVRVFTDQIKVSGKEFCCHSPTEKTKTAGGMTKIPTSQSATASEVTKRFVTVRNLLVVMTDRITKVFPIIVMIINKQNSTISTIFSHGQLTAATLFCSVKFIFTHYLMIHKGS